MPRGLSLTKSGRYQHAKGTEKAGKFASAAEVEAAYLRDAGYFKNRAGRYQKVAGGQFATKAEIEEARTGGANTRVNEITWNQITNNPEEYKGFLNWSKGGWTDRNRGVDPTEGILNITGTKNLNEALQVYAGSKSRLLYNSIKYIDGATLIREFSGFLGPDVSAYIEELRRMTKEERYDEAKVQEEAYIAKYGL